MASMTLCLPSPTLCPYTTLFRSLAHRYFYDAVNRAVRRVTHDAGAAPFGVPQIAFAIDHRAIGVATAIGDIGDRKSTRLNSSHVKISYAVFCLKKKKQTLQNDDG